MKACTPFFWLMASMALALPTSDHVVARADDDCPPNLPHCPTDPGSDQGGETVSNTNPLVYKPIKSYPYQQLPAAPFQEMGPNPLRGDSPTVLPISPKKSPESRRGSSDAWKLKDKLVLEWQAGLFLA